MVRNERHSVDLIWVYTVCLGLSFSILRVIIEHDTGALKSSASILRLTLSTLSKIFSIQHIEIFFLFFPESRICRFMQIVSIGDNLHEMLNPVFWEK